MRKDPRGYCINKFFNVDQNLYVEKMVIIAKFIFNQISSNLFSFLVEPNNYIKNIDTRNALYIYLM